MKKVNPNWIGLALLLGAWGYSAVRYAVIATSLAKEEDPDAGLKVIRVLHWQLEPGYRDGLDLVMTEYNNLPHVKAAGVEVRQMAVTERVYAQFINVHLISGTAPDICVKGMSSLLGSSAAAARFFEPISGHVKEPNPYNQGNYLPEEVEPHLAEFLQNSAWNETFTDGMLGGWDDTMQDYYAVPVSSWGALRTFINTNLVAEIKTWMAAEWDRNPQPAWMRDLIETQRLVTPDDDFLAWLRSPAPPLSLGRFMFFNEATLQFARATPGREKLVPIAASSYTATHMTDRYVVAFTAHLANTLDNNQDSQITANEILGSWQAGKWNFDEPSLRKGYFDVVTWLAKYYPKGFMGLDREQSVRRFLSGQSVFISTGGWDAPTLFNGAKGKFDIAVVNAPMPIAGERWFEYSAGFGNEAESKLGVPMSIYKNSRNKEWALDFLRYITSYSANQRMNQTAGWIPCVVGAFPVERMVPFIPRTEGLKSSVCLNLWSLPTVDSVYQGAFPLFQTGNLTYEAFVENVTRGWKDERNGVNRMWFNMFVGAQDKARQNDRAMVLVRIQSEKSGWTPELRNKQANLIESSLRDFDGFGPVVHFHTFFPDRTFPIF
jgi:raffinose/stachyose/melibiose transport system substrate-binding protein